MKKDPQPPMPLGNNDTPVEVSFC